MRWRDSNALIGDQIPINVLQNISRLARDALLVAVPAGCKKQRSPDGRVHPGAVEGVVVLEVFGLIEIEGDFQRPSTAAREGQGQYLRSS